MLMLVAIRTRVDTRIHPVQSYSFYLLKAELFIYKFNYFCLVPSMVNWIFRYIKKGMFVEVGKSEISPDFASILKLLVDQNEYLAFAPDTKETRFMLKTLAIEFPLIKVTTGQKNIFQKPIICFLCSCIL